MSSGSSGSDETISTTKIPPLASDQKTNAPHDTRGAADIEQARIAPLGGGGRYQHTAPHARTGGVVGRDADIAGARIEPLGGGEGVRRRGRGEGGKGGSASASARSTGLGLGLGLDEVVDKARIRPLGGVREEIL
ncbi:hypothetical protein F5B20DRAFT_157359 [Whalleya microplaca]|nr:hypothetical protein F5B20DRAFT_157359 [Whalleya microplaca]